MKKYFCERACDEGLVPIWHKINEEDEKTYICNAECPLYCTDEYGRCKIKVSQDIKLEETTASSICPIDYVPKWEEIVDNEEEGEGECILRP